MYPLKVDMRVEIINTSTIITIAEICNDASFPYIIDTAGRTFGLSNIRTHFPGAYVLVHMPDNDNMHQGPGWADMMDPADGQVAIIETPISGYWKLTDLKMLDRLDYNWDERWLEPITEAEYLANKDRPLTISEQKIPVGQFATITPFVTHENVNLTVMPFIGKKVEIIRFRKLDNIYECRPQWTEGRIQVAADMLAYPAVDTEARFKISSDKGETPFVMSFTEAAQLYVELQPLKTQLIQVYPE